MQTSEKHQTIKLQTFETLKIDFYLNFGAWFLNFNYEGVV